MEGDDGNFQTPPNESKIKMAVKSSLWGQDYFILALVAISYLTAGNLCLSVVEYQYWI